MATRCRELTLDELELVSGGRYIPGWGWEVTGHSGGSSNDWAFLGLFGGTWLGLAAGAEATEGFAALVEAGVIGAEYGSLAGPVGIAAGAVVGVASGLVAYNYGPNMARGLQNLL